VTGEADVDRVHIRERRESDHERAMHWLIRQYGEHLANEADALGGWDMLGRALQRRVMRARDERPEGDPDDLLGEGRPF
jgi:cytochrome c-type biogenesis protein CcmH/NrfG